MVAPGFLVSLQTGLLGGPISHLFAGLVALAVVVLVGRFVLNVAWKLLLVATVVVGVLFLLTTVSSF